MATPDRATEIIFLVLWAWQLGNLEFVVACCVAFFHFLYREALGHSECCHSTAWYPWVLWVPRRSNTYLETFSGSVPSSMFWGELRHFCWSGLVNMKIQCFSVFPTLISQNQFKIQKKTEYGVFEGRFFFLTRKPGEMHARIVGEISTCCFHYQIRPHDSTPSKSC